MCVHITPAQPSAVQRLTGREPMRDYPAEVFPGNPAPIIQSDAEGSSGFKVDLALFGLIPSWAKDRGFGRRTYNARSETVAEKPSYRAAWRQRQFCLVPMERFFEPCWETGKAVPWSICRRDGEPFAVAGLWDRWTDKATGEIVASFSMLTINADGHPIMGRFHRPGDERRSLVVVSSEKWTDWLYAKPETAGAMLVDIPMAEFISAPAVVGSSSEPVQGSLL